MPRPISKIPKVIEVGGWFYVAWYDEKSRRTHRLSLRTQDAEVATKLFANFLQDGRSVYENHGPGITAGQALDQYEKEHVDKKCADKGRQRVAIRNLKAHFENVIFRNIDIPACREYARRRREGEIGGGKRLKSAVVGDSTIRRELVTLTAAANHAIAWKRMTLAEMPSIELTDGKTKRKPQFYTKDELRLLLDTATGELKQFLRLLYWTGARRASIEELKPVQINGEHIDLLTPGKQQTKKRMPIIPLYDDIRPDLDSLIERAGGKTSTRPLFGRDMYREYHEHCAAWGLADKGYPHIMRHTRATHMLQDGVSIYDVAKLLGDTVKTIEDNYGHHSAEFMKHKTSGGL